jgi:Acetyltransferase (isoleucine patch superfamily)
MYVQAHMTIPIQLFLYYEIGEGAVIGAGTVMVKDAEPWGVYAGNPAKYIKKEF